MSLYEDYWRNNLPSPPPEKPAAGKYLTFELDLGGLNNIRMQLEYLTVLAAVTGRTLVLPPADAWYLINRGPMSRAGAPGLVSRHEDFFDIPALAACIDVIPVDEFLRREQGRFDIPRKFMAFTEPPSPPSRPEQQESRRTLREEWLRWQRASWRVVPWNPLHNLIFYPDIQAVVDGPSPPDEAFIDGRTPVWIDQRFEAAPVVHFPCDIERGMRQLGQITKTVAFADDRQAPTLWGILRAGVRFVPEVFSYADLLISEMGRFEYTSLHLRRNDFQYDLFRVDPGVSANAIDDLLAPGEPLYLATDELDEEFLDAIGKGRDVYRYADLVKRAAEENPPEEKFAGCVEQLVCAAGRRFIGTPQSSFSSYISRIRGYIGAPDLGTYYHTAPKAQLGQAQGFIRRTAKGRSYMTEDPALWEDADLELPLYSVVCTDTQAFGTWQCELLEYSWRKVAQPGQLIRLVSARQDEVLPSHSTATVIRTPFTNVHPDTGDQYIPYNRLFSFQTWLESGPPPGTVLILDPDCVFRDRLPMTVAPGSPVAQRWRGFGLGERWLDSINRHSTVDPDQLQEVTWPALVHTEDLRRVISRWIELTAKFRQDIGAWESDMMAFVVSAAEVGIRFREEHIVAVMNFPEDQEKAPIIHYCQPVEAKDGSRLWYKQGYVPWQPVYADPGSVRLNYCADLLAILNEYVDTRSDPEFAVEKTPHRVAALQDKLPDATTPDRYLVRIWLESGRVIETECAGADQTLSQLFSALDKNALASGNNAPYLVETTSGAGAHFNLAQVVALETVPMSSGVQESATGRK